MASSKAMVNSTLGLRLLALLLLAASVVVLVTDKFVFSDGSKITFKDVYAYRYQCHGDDRPLLLLYFVVI